MDLKIFKQKTFRISVILSSVITMGLFAQIFLVPIYAQEVLGFSPLKTGLVLFPAAVLQAVLQPISGHLLDRYGPRYLVVGGLLSLAVATLALSRVSISSSFNFLAVVLGFRGLGVGMSAMTTTTAGLNSVVPAKVAEASALTNTIRQISASSGLVLLTLLYELRYTYYLRLHERMNGLSLKALQQAKASAIGDGFLLITMLTILIIPLAWKLKHGEE